MDTDRQELNKKIDTGRQELKEEIKSLANKVEDMDRRLCRIEGSLTVHGHCLFHQSKSEQKKAE